MALSAFMVGIRRRKGSEIMGPETQNLPEQDDIVVEDLIEEVSIDGMCGVY